MGMEDYMDAQSDERHSSSSSEERGKAGPQFQRVAPAQAVVDLDETQKIIKFVHSRCRVQYSGTLERRDLE